MIGEGGVERTNAAYERIKSRCYVIDAASLSCQATSPVPDWVGGEGDGAASTSTDKSALEELLGDVYNDPQPSHPVNTPQQQVDYEVKCFKSESTVSLKSNPLLWWKTKEGLYPHLAKIVRQLFCIPATSVPSERVFSAAGHLVSATRNRLDQENVNNLLFIQQNIPK